MRQAAALPLLLLTVLWARPAVADWNICGEGDLHVTGGDVEPYPAHAGQEVVFRVNGSLAKEVSGGTLEVWVDYLGFHVYSSTGDICEAVQCPLAAGPQTLVFRQQLPKVAPPGPYLGVFQGRDAGGTVLFCVDINFRITLGSWQQDGDEDMDGGGEVATD